MPLFTSRPDTVSIDEAIIILEKQDNSGQTGRESARLVRQLKDWALEFTSKSDRLGTVVRHHLDAEVFTGKPMPPPASRRYI